jgi:hypothetical protein
VRSLVPDPIEPTADDNLMLANRICDVPFARTPTLPGRNRWGRTPPED